MRFRGLLALVVPISACGGSSGPDLAIEPLAEDRWRDIVVEPYRELYPEYVAAFAPRAPGLRSQLAAPGAVVMRKHFAGDPALTMEQTITRWALPVLFDSRVATKRDAPIDAVFVRQGQRWRPIVGLEQIVRARIAAREPACAALLGTTEPDACRQVTWELAEAALRNQAERFTRVCALAQSLCGKRSP